MIFPAINLHLLHSFPATAGAVDGESRAPTAATPTEGRGPLGENSGEIWAISPW